MCDTIVSTECCKCKSNHGHAQCSFIVSQKVTCHLAFRNSFERKMKANAGKCMFCLRVGFASGVLGQMVAIILSKRFGSSLA
mmetsp:Transcript_32619/g.55546  ORF Transcript_32619/g.55546 Transcript_32619/m.55546 type:complete len:82 (+) Transcript_32619:1254-1499(+)